MIENSYPAARHPAVDDTQTWLKDSSNGVVVLKNPPANTGNQGATENGVVEDKLSPPKPKLHANVKSRVDETEQEEATLVIGLKDNMACLGSILKAIDVRVRKTSHHSFNLLFIKKNLHTSSFIVHD